MLSSTFQFFGGFVIMDIKNTKAFQNGFMQLTDGFIGLGNGLLSLPANVENASSRIATANFKIVKNAFADFVKPAILEGPRLPRGDAIPSCLYTPATSTANSSSPMQEGMFTLEQLAVRINQFNRELMSREINPPDNDCEGLKVFESVVTKMTKTVSSGTPQEMFNDPKGRVVSLYSIGFSQAGGDGTLSLAEKRRIGRRLGRGCLVVQDKGTHKGMDVPFGCLESAEVNSRGVVEITSRYNGQQMTLSLKAVDTALSSTSSLSPSSSDDDEDNDNDSSSSSSTDNDNPSLALQATDTATGDLIRHGSSLYIRVYTPEIDDFQDEDVDEDVDEANASMSSPPMSNATPDDASAQNSSGNLEDSEDDDDEENVAESEGDNEENDSNSLQATSFLQSMSLRPKGQEVTNSTQQSQQQPSISSSLHSRNAVRVVPVTKTSHRHLYLCYRSSEAPHCLCDPPPRPRNLNQSVPTPTYTADHLLETLTCGGSIKTRCRILPPSSLPSDERQMKSWSVQGQNSQCDTIYIKSSEDPKPAVVVGGDDQGIKPALWVVMEDADDQVIHLDDTSEKLGWYKKKEENSVLIPKGTYSTSFNIQTQILFESSLDSVHRDRATANSWVYWMNAMKNQYLGMNKRTIAMHAQGRGNEEGPPQR